MNKRNAKSAPGFSNFGFSTILLSFVMICIVTIAALSLLTANSDYKLSQKVAEKNTAYFQAEQEAFTILSEIDTLLASAYQKSLGASSYYKQVYYSLQELSYGSYDRMAGTYSYCVKIAENHSLEVTIYIRYPKNENESFYEIQTWKSVYNIEEPEEGTLDLID